METTDDMKIPKAKLTAVKKSTGSIPAFLLKTYEILEVTSTFG